MREYQDILLDPRQCVLLMLDIQPQMFFGAEGSFQNMVMLRLQGLAKTAKIFHVPCILSTLAATAFAGPLYSGVQEVFAQFVPIDRTSLNAFEDGNIQRAVQSSSRKKLLLAGLWTEAGITFTALSALREGYQVFLVEDACAGMTKTAHDSAVSRMEQAGAVRVTWGQVLLEFQRDWSDRETSAEVLKLLAEHGGGACYMGMEYAREMRKR
mgnify:CR=1 FL=1